jgi:hypothetical protein
MPVDYTACALSRGGTLRLPISAAHLLAAAAAVRAGAAAGKEIITPPVNGSWEVPTLMGSEIY